MRKWVLVVLVLSVLMAACGSQSIGNAPTGATEATSAAQQATAAPASSTEQAATSTGAATAATSAAQQPTAASAQATEAAATTTTGAAATSAAQPTGQTASAGGKLVVMSHDSFNVSDDVIKAFEQQTGSTIEVLKSGDAGAALNKAILSKNAPLGDVFFGVDNTFLSRALDAGIFEPYAAPPLANIPAQFKLDPSNNLLPIDYGYVSINYDKNYLQQHNLPVPQKLEDLTKPEWKSKLVVENPATSSPGLAFMLATIGTFGTQGSYTWLDFWKALRANDVMISEGWEDAYYTQFSGSSGKGPRPLVVSYTSSPPAEVIASNGKLKDAPTGVLTAGSFLQIEFAGILKGTKQRALAERFLDFMLSKKFQEDMPLQMYVYPVIPDATLPDVFKQFTPVVEKPAKVDPKQIEQNRDTWIKQWNAAVLREP
jgi:thiamine transport system substrate-binding protein